MLLNYEGKYINTDNVLWYNVKDLTMLIYLGKDNTVKLDFKSTSELNNYIEFLEAVHGGFIAGKIWAIRYTYRLLLKKFKQFIK